MLVAPAIRWGAAEREQLRVAGFVELPRAISPGGLRQLNAAVDEHLAAGAPPMVTAPWLFPGSVVGEALWRLASEPAVVGLARELCGPNVLLWAGGTGSTPSGTFPNAITFGNARGVFSLELAH